MWKTWANLLTLCRLCLAPLCAWMVIQSQWPAAALLFGLAVASDLLDGPLARRLNQSSAFGGLFDHATDACFVTLLLAALAWQGLIPWPLPPLVAAAFAQYVYDSRVRHGRPLRGSRLGRLNGIGYFIVAGVPVCRNALGLDWPGDTLWSVAGWLLVVSTLVSMASRARHAFAE